MKIVKGNSAGPQPNKKNIPNQYEN